MDLYDSVKNVPLIGEHYAKLLKRLDISTIEDLLFHIPLRYTDFSTKTSIKELKIGKTTTIEAKVEKIQNIYTKRGKNIQIAEVKDNTGIINIVWFNQPYLYKTIKRGAIYYFSGKVDFFNFKKAIISPEFEKKDKDETIHTGRLVPIYPLTKGISNKWMRSRIRQALNIYKRAIKENLPKEDLENFNIMNKTKALEQVHFPSNKEEAKKAKERIALEELLKVQLVSLYKKNKWQRENRSEKLSTDKAQEEFNRLIPFKLTKDQKKLSLT